MVNSKQVLIIGLDGFTWRIGRKLILESHMPVLAKLLKDGCHGTLKSVVPYETSPAWTSFQTGCYPNKTGIFAFHGYSRKTRKIRLNSFREIRTPTIWELLSDAGKRVISINMPMTSPPPEINGIIIPGLTCPVISRETVFPPSVYDQYIKSNPDYCVVDNSIKPNLKSYVNTAVKTEQIRCDLALELMQNENWDLFSVQIQSTDAFQHKNWWALDPTAEGFTDADYNQALEFYKGIDRIIGELVKTAGDSVLTVIASDHGFCSKKAEIGINTWLLRNGHLVLKPSEPQRLAETLKETLKAKIPLLKYLARIYGQSVKSIRSYVLRRKRRQELYSETVVKHIRETIDLDRSLAFCLGGMGGSLYITDTTRKDEIRGLIEKLLADYGPNSPNPLIASIEPVKRPNSDTDLSFSCPDYMIKLMAGVEARISPEGQSVVRPGIIDNKQAGTHEQDGVFALHGLQVKKKLVFDADIVDIAPTLLSYLGVPVPDYTNGKALEQAFKEPLNIEHIASNGIIKETSDSSNDDQSTVEKQLRDLGYL